MTGCNVKKLTHQQALRPVRLVDFRAVIAWRVAAIAMPGHETSEQEASSLFSEVELAAVGDYAALLGEPVPKILGRAAILRAAMGWHLSQKGDSTLGNEVMRDGFCHWSNCASIIDRAQAVESDSLNAKVINE